MAYNTNTYMLKGKWTQHMMPEEEVKQEEQKKKPQRVFGEEDLEPKQTRPVQKKKTRAAGPDGEEKQRAKKVDKAIGRDVEEDSDFTEKKKPAPKKKKSSKKKKSAKKNGAGETFMRMGRGLKAGSVTVGQYSKKVMKLFDAYTAGDGEADTEGINAFFNRLLERMGWAGRLKFSAFIIASLLILALTLTFFNNTNIQVQHVTVSVAGLHDDLEGYTICLLSDLHGRQFGTRQATLLRAVNGENYDMMLLAGDMVGAGGNPQPFYELLEGLTGNKPVYFIAGDSDPGPLRDAPNVVEGKLEEFVLQDWVLGAVDRGAVYVDSPESLKVDDAVIWLTPESMMNLESSSTVSALNRQVHLESNEVLENQAAAAYAALPFTSYYQQNMLELQTRIPQMKNEDLHISLAHIPPCSIPRVSDGSDGYLPTVDLIVAGHYCGGVWRVPLLGALYIPSVEAPRHGWFPGPNEAEGLSLLGSANLYITGGLGVTDQVYLPDFRLNNQPKVTILRLTAKLTDDLLGLNN